MGFKWCLPSYEIIDISTSYMGYLDLKLVDEKYILKKGKNPANKNRTTQIKF